jgi:hypothetical protein
VGIHSHCARAAPIPTLFCTEIPRQYIPVYLGHSLFAAYDFIALHNTRILLFEYESTPYRHMFPFIVCILNNRQCGACIGIPGCRFDLDSMLCMRKMMETPLKVRVLNGHWIHPPDPNSTIVDTHCVALAPSMDVRGVTLSIDACMSRIWSTTHFDQGSIYGSIYKYILLPS